jgi:putative DNA primase/helicase
MTPYSPRPQLGDIISRTRDSLESLRASQDSTHELLRARAFNPAIEPAPLRRAASQYKGTDMTTAEILSRLEQVKKTADGWMAECPGHPDKTPSLCIKACDDGRTLFHCQAGCQTETVCAALGIKLADLFAEKPKRNGAGKQIVATYPYHDAAGKLLFEVVRFEPKDFRQRRPDSTAQDGWTWNTKGVDKVLFQLPEVIAAIEAGRRIYLTEGEKDALAMVKHGFAATCNCGGAGKWQPSYSETLRGADVVIVADKDAAGRKHAADVARQLHSVARTVKTIELRDVNGKPVKDAADFFAAGGEAADLDGIAEAASEFDPSTNTTEPETKSEIPPPVAYPLAALARPAQDDASELLRRRFLCRWAWLLLCGPTGVGKSALEMQAAILWALGRPCFGIEPTQPLKSLIVQAENDAGDLAEMRDGVIKGLGLTEADAATACGNVLVCREDEFCGVAFWSRARSLLEQYRPDIFWIDPALAYIGGEANSQRDVGGFLRNGLNPLLRECNCAAVVVHHTNKPASGHEKPKWQAGDYAYLGAGSAEWANAARAVLALRSVGSHDVFELHAAKRGARLNWRDDQGKKAFVKYIGHAKEPGVICWHEVAPNEIESGGGRPKSYDTAELLALLPPEGMTATQWWNEAKGECGIKERRFFDLIKSLEQEGKITKSKITKKWQPRLPKSRELQ